MEKRKSAIIESLIERTNIIADAHLKISTQEVTKIFRRGLRYSTEGAIAPSDAEQKKPKDLREDSSDEFKEPECAMEVLSVDDADQDKEVLPVIAFIHRYFMEYSNKPCTLLDGKQRIG